MRYIYILGLLICVSCYAGQLQFQDENKELQKQKLDNLSSSQYEKYIQRRNTLLKEDYEVYIQKGDSILGRIIEISQSASSSNLDKEIAKKIAKEYINFEVFKEQLHYIDVPDSQYKMLSK